MSDPLTDLYGPDPAVNDAAAQPLIKIKKRGLAGAGVARKSVVTETDETASAAETPAGTTQGYVSFITDCDFI
jgi:hypothetical protein